MSGGGVEEGAVPTLGRVALAAGGTGGHVFPAEALKRVLNERGTSVVLVTDARGRRFAGGFDNENVQVVPSGGLVTGSFTKRLSGLAKIGLGALACLRSFYRDRPEAVVGFGSYASLPGLIAAVLLRIPIALHEQNSVMGAANKLFLTRAQLVGLSFPIDAYQDHESVTVVGNFVRASVREAAAIEPPADGLVRILVLGGSQGSSEVSEVVTAALATLEPPTRSRLRVVHQARSEDVSVKTDYEASGIAATVQDFVDVGEALSATDLVIARSGASTVWDVAVSGRPAVYLPLSAHRDRQQMANARHVANAGGAIVLENSSNAGALAEAVRGLVEEPSVRLAMGRAASKWAGPDASAEFVDRLAFVVHAT